MLEQAFVEFRVHMKYAYLSWQSSKKLWLFSLGPVVVKLIVRETIIQNSELFHAKLIQSTTWLSRIALKPGERVYCKDTNFRAEFWLISYPCLSFVWASIVFEHIACTGIGVDVIGSSGSLNLWRLKWICILFKDSVLTTQTVQ